MSNRRHSQSDTKLGLSLLNSEKKITRSDSIEKKGKLNSKDSGIRKTLPGFLHSSTSSEALGKCQGTGSRINERRPTIRPMEESTQMSTKNSENLEKTEYKKERIFDLKDFEKVVVKRSENKTENNEKKSFKPTKNLNGFVDPQDQFKYGSYSNLISLYESEKTLRKQFEDLYFSGLEEAKELRSNIKPKKSFKDITYDSIAEDLNLEFDELKIKEIEALKNEIKLLKQKKDEIFTEKTCKFCEVYLSDIQNLKEKIESIKDYYEKELNKLALYQTTLSKCTTCEILQKKLAEYESQASCQSKLQPEPRFFFCESCEAKEKQNQAILLKYKSKIKKLKKRPEAEYQKKESPQDAMYLQTLVSSLKSKNSELSSHLRQILQEYNHYECHTLFKNSSSSLSAETLAKFKKPQIIETFKSLQKEYKELSNKLLSQADEMFENKREISEMKKSNSEMYKELLVLRDQNMELLELKEHVSYLLHVIHEMKEKVTAVGEIYKETVVNEFENSAEFKNAIDVVSNLIKTSIEHSKKLKFCNWKDEAGKNNLISVLKFSLVSYSKK